MKYIILILGLFVSIPLFSQNSDYYYYKGKKINLDVNKKRAYVIYKEKANDIKVTKNYYFDRKLKWQKKQLKSASVEQYAGVELILHKDKSYQEHLALLKQNTYCTHPSFLHFS